MITPRGTAARRLREDLKFQYRCWRVAIDWTVALYIVVPALFFAGYQYHLWYQEAPVWMRNVTYPMARNFLFLWTVAGTLRYYVLEADQLFLYQRTSWFRRMMAWGAGYSLLTHGVLTALVGAAAYPLLSRAFGVDPLEAVLLFVLIGLFKAYVMLAKQWLGIRYMGWTGWLIEALLFVPAGILFRLLTMLPTGSPLLACAAAAVLAAPLWSFVSARIRLQGAFFQDVRREQQEKLKVAGILLALGGLQAPRKAKLRRKKPLLLSDSGRLYRTRSPENVIAETLIKAAYRSGTKLQMVVTSVVIYSSAIVLSPAGLRYIVWGLVSLLCVYMARSYAKEGANEGFVRLFHWQDGIRFAAFRKACFGISLPLIVILSLLAGLLQLGPLQGLLLVPVGVAFAWIATAIATLGGSS